MSGCAYKGALTLHGQSPALDQAKLHHSVGLVMRRSGMPGTVSQAILIYSVLSAGAGQASQAA